MRVYCKFCTKNQEGFCSVKTGARVSPQKKRKCAKYREDTPLKISYEVAHEENVKKIPTFKPTYRYYQALNGEKVDEGALYVRVNPEV